MKLAYDHQIFAMQEHGGVSRYFIELAKHLSVKPGVELNVIVPFHFNRYLRDSDLKPIFGYQIPKSPISGKLARFANGIATRQWLKNHDLDILHATYYSLKGKAANNQARLVVTVHDMIHELYPGEFDARDRTAQLRRAAVAEADHVICVSHNTKRDLIRYIGTEPEKVSVIHHGINRINVSTGRKEESPRSPYILYVGKRGGYKNFATLLLAFATSKELNSRFSLVCFGGGRFNKDELSRHKHLGLKNDQVHWIGGDDATLARLYNNATAFVYPSLYEGFGMPPLEAMSFQCPVLCSKGGSIPEVVGDAGHYFDPLDSASLLSAILKVVNDNSYADELRSRGLVQIGNFSWSKCAEETLEVYESLI